MNTIVLSSVKEALAHLGSMRPGTMLTVDGRRMRIATVLHGEKVLRVMDSSAYNNTPTITRPADGRVYPLTHNTLRYSNAVLEV